MWSCDACPYRIPTHGPWDAAEVAEAIDAHRVAHHPGQLTRQERDLEKCRRMVVAIARTEIDRFPGLEVADVEQEAMIAVLEASQRYDADRGVPFPRFADTVIRLRLNDLHARVARQKHVPLNTAVVVVHGPDGQEIQMLELLAARTPGPYRIVAARETLGELAAAIRSDLTPMERRSLAGVVNGVPYDEIGDRRSVDNAVQRARRKLAAASHRPLC